MLEHLENHNLTGPNQDGCLQRKSCLTNPLTALEDVTAIASFDEVVDVDMIFNDLAKTFNCIPHKRLLHKLAACGTKGSVLAWTNEFLMERK